MQLFSAPEFVNWNYTYGCNLSCLHCYSRCGRYPSELPTDSYLRIADTLAESGVFTVAFGGGEPLIRRDFTAVHERLKRRGVATFLTTNGWYLDRETARELASSHLDKLLISIDHWDQCENDRVRGEGSHRAALKALSFALENQLSCAISCVVSQWNLESLNGLVELADRVGVAEIELKKFRPSGNGFTNRDFFELRETDEAVVARLTDIQSHEVRTTLLGFTPYSEAKFCGCGWRSACIRPNGDVTHCPYTDIVAGNLRESDLREIWLRSSVLNSIRTVGACEALQGVASPSNPLLTVLTQPTVPTL